MFYLQNHPGLFGALCSLNSWFFFSVSELSLLETWESRHPGNDGYISRWWPENPGKWCALILFFLFLHKKKFSALISPSPTSTKVHVFFFVSRSYSKLQRRLWSVSSAGLRAPAAHEPWSWNLRARARLHPAVSAFELTGLPHVQRSHLQHALTQPARATYESEMGRRHSERKARERHSGESSAFATGRPSALVETVVAAEKIPSLMLIT